MPTKVHLVKAMVFPVVMHGCESWTIKKVEHWRIDALELWCQRRLLRVPWTARSNQSILNETKPEYSLKGLIVEAEVPILWPPNAKSQLIGKEPDAGKDWRQKEKRVAEDEMVRYHHQLTGYKSEPIPGDSEAQIRIHWVDDDMEKEMATHSSVLASRIPGTGAWWAAVYGVAQSWNYWCDLAAAAAA